MPQLEINNIDVAIGDGKIALSKSAYPVNDWLTKAITFSQRIQLPETSQLNGMFKRPKATSVNAKKFSKYYSFKYKDNGQIIFKGTARLWAHNASGNYEVQLLDSSVELFKNMDNKLTALELDSEDFIFNSAAYTALKNLNSTLWIWSAASMHKLKVLSKNILSGELAFSRPFFSVRRLLEKIFDANSWSYELGVNAELIDSLIISSNASTFVFTSYEKEFNEDVVVAGSQLLDLTSPDFIKTDSLTGSNILNLNYTSNIRFRGYIDAPDNFILRINGTSSGATDSLTQSFAINKGRFFYDLTSNAFETSDATYNLSFELIGTGTITLEDFRLYTLINEDDFGAMSSKVFVDFKVKTYDNIPDVTQKDLFKHALVNVAGFFTTDNLRKIINISSMVNLSRLSAIDFTDKFIEDSVKARPLTGYAKTNYFAYAEDDAKPVNLGRGAFEVDDETFADAMNVYSSIFAASNEVEITDDQIDLGVYDDTERINDLSTIIGYYETVSTYTVARFADLNGDALLENYWSGFIQAIQKGEIIEANFDLNKSDFFLFKFTNFIYLAGEFKSAFFVLNIQNYIENEQTTLILLKT